MNANAERRATRQIAVALGGHDALRARARGRLPPRRPDPARRHPARARARRARLRVRRDARASSSPRVRSPRSASRSSRAPRTSTRFAQRLRRGLRRRPRRGRHRPTKASRGASSSPGCSAPPRARSGSPRCSPSRRSDRGPATRCSSRSGGKGSRVVNEQGEPVNVDDLEVGGVITVFPAGPRRRRRQPDAADPRSQTGGDHPARAARPGRPEGYVAYSKVCTHAGCPVGLYQQSIERLLCPCHQSTFEVRERRHARVRAGDPLAPPAPAHGRRRRLPAVAERLQPARSGPASGTATADGRRAHGVRGLDKRLGVARFARTALNKVFPDHWSFMIGEIAMYCLVILILTGVYLTFFFVPDSRQVVYDGSYAPLQGVRMSAAYESTLHVTFDVRAGLVMRQIHHWAALLFVGVDPRAPAAHLLHRRVPQAARAQLDGRPHAVPARRSPTGSPATASPTTCSPGTGLRIAYSVLLSIPFARALARVPRVRRRVPERRHHPAPLRDPRPHRPGADRRAADRSTSLMLVRQKHTQFAGRGRTERNVVGSKLWPTFTAKTLGLLLLRVRGVRRARRPGADQPGLALRPVRAVGGERGLAARLVHRLARGRAPAHAAVGAAHRRVRDPEPVLPRACCCPGITFTLLYALAVDRGAVHQGPRGAPPPRPAARPAASAPRSASRSWRSTSCCSSPVATTSSPRTSTCR